MSRLTASAVVRAAAGAALLVAASAALAAAPASGDTDPRHIIAPYDPRLDAVRAPAGFGTGQIWHVGPDEPYKRPSEIVSRVHDGDIVEIDAARYACDTGVKWAASNLTIIGVGGRPVLDATHCTVEGDKGIWNPVGKGLIVDNIEFVGAAGPSQNDAGIRYDGTGYVLITHCYIHDNEDGILATPSDGAATDIVIDHSDFDHNGTDTGSTHNIYISSSSPHGVNSFVIRFSYSHGARVGHQVKTRALTNYILYNRLADEEAGDSSYAIDISQGGLTYIIGNVIQHGAKAQNWAMISYSSEDRPNPVQEVYVASNTFVNEIPDHGVALNLYDHGLTAARMVNNLVTGIDPANLVGDASSKITLSHNVITASPGFYDQANRNYHLAAHAAAIGAGVDPGTVHGMSLAPAFEFEFPATGVPRPALAHLDAGAYQYQAGQVLPPPPAIRLSAKSPLDYDTPTTLTWEAKDALYCGASGDWSGSVAPSGRYSSPPLTSRKTYALSCTGPGGSASQSLAVAVNESPEAAKLGTYVWHDIPGSALKTVCASDIKDSSGSSVYADDFGTGPNCESKGNGGMGVYVPTTRTWYLMGGNGARNYYGNEIYGFDVATLKPELVTLPDHIADTKEYVPDDEYGSKIHIPGCNAILHLKSGGIVRAPSGIENSAAWDPKTGKIDVGPGDYVRGSEGCGDKEAGEVSTDLWSFTPPV
ncbi:MAG TPA: hypothetical protein VL993_19780, partial [Stellaceae bacterium]|nr:hypothetical protein [Stellaceae bacterium]